MVYNLDIVVISLLISLPWSQIGVLVIIVLVSIYIKNLYDLIASAYTIKNYMSCVFKLNYFHLNLVNKDVQIR